MDVFLRRSRAHALDIVTPLIRSEQNPSFLYCAENTAFIFPKGVQACESHFDELIHEFDSSNRRDLELGRVSLAPSQHFASIPQIWNFVKNAGSIMEFATPIAKFADQSVGFEFNRLFKEVTESQSVASRFDQWTMVIKNILELDHGSVMIFTDSLEQSERVSTLLGHREIDNEIVKEKLILAHRGLPTRVNKVLILVGG
jgi:hypothetical protein